jgi:tetratricopeptide (TPR) repeat protein
MKAKQSSANTAEQLHHAQLLHQSGQLAEAEVLYKKLLKILPRHPAILTALGTIALQQGQFTHACMLLGKSLKLEPNQPSAQSNRGIAFIQLARLTEAAVCFETAIRLKPDYFEACNNLGNVLHDLRRFDEALSHFDRAIAIKPDYAEAYSNRGNVLQDLGRFTEALQWFERTISLKPEYAQAYYNHGNALKELDRPAEAVISFERAIALLPNHVEAHNNRAMALQQLKQLDRAIAGFDQAIAINSNYPDPYWNKALLKILLGQYEEGWQLYEWRWRNQFKFHIRKFKQPLWLGEPTAADKILLVYPEQGLGDFIQFCRYVPMLESKFARVVIEAPDSLMPLLRTLKGNVTLVEQGQPLPEFDLQIPIMSLPLAFKTTVNDIPSPIHYLYSDRDKQTYWQERLGKKTRLRIGLAWSGAAKHVNDRNRSIPLMQLRPLLTLAHEFHCLQTEIREADKAFLNQYGQLRMHLDALHDFADTAALINEMDLIISVDTSVAHLAGALGKPVWILLPFLPDYRWMLDRRDSPWYPGAILYRQPAAGNWASVVFDVTQDLEAMPDVLNKFVSANVKEHKPI